MTQSGHFEAAPFCIVDRSQLFGHMQNLIWRADTDSLSLAYGQPAPSKRELAAKLTEGVRISPTNQNLPDWTDAYTQ